MSDDHRADPDAAPTPAEAAAQDAPATLAPPSIGSLGDTSTEMPSSDASTRAHRTDPAVDQTAPQSASPRDGGPRPGGEIPSTEAPPTGARLGVAATKPAAGALDLGTERYTVQTVLGVGGQGVVYRVFDRKMWRPLAMKVLKPRASARARTRFETETAITVGLEHPGIVPIHDRGRTVDGRPWYTMPILDGAEFAEQIRDAAVPLRRRVEILARACEAVAYAHRQGVIHRDLKPGNIMIGGFGEVRVLDWGLARRLSEPSPTQAAAIASLPDLGLTRAGAVMGTPRYMAPEQLAGALEVLGPPTDVYAIGLMLAEILTGEPPAGRTIEGVMARRAVDLDPPPVGPETLRALCARTTRASPVDRLADAGLVAAEIRTWLEGERRRAQSACEVTAAQALEPRIAAHRAEAERLEIAAAEILDPLPPHAPVEARREGWALADAATIERREARLLNIRLRQTLQSALQLDPDSVEARAALTAHDRAGLLDAEAAGDADRAAEFEALLLGHDRAANAEWLRGDGRLTVVTDPPGATVEVRRYETVDRRLVAQPFEGPLGGSPGARTPLIEVPLAMGSYLLVLRAPGRATVRYPVVIDRHAHWDGIPPGGDGTHAIHLPAADTIGEGEIYVPAGWCTLGGDPKAMDRLPRRRVWIDGYIVTRHPITHGEYIDWLNALVEAGRADEAVAHAPRESSQVRRGQLAYGRDERGRFTLTEAFGDRPEPDWPVVGMTWSAAMAYAAWRADRDGIRWRLPTSWEWEKAARGVDQRAFPWGDHFAVSWAQVLNHAPGPPCMSSVGRHPTDASPYGVEGQGGNVRDLCADVYRRLGPELVDGRLTASCRPEATDFLVVKGGCYSAQLEACRAASRFGMPRSARLELVGFRLARPYRRRPSTA